MHIYIYIKVDCMSNQHCISQTAHTGLLYLVHTYTGMFYHLIHDNLICKHNQLCDSSLNTEDVLGFLHIPQAALCLPVAQDILDLL